MTRAEQKIRIMQVLSRAEIIKIKRLHLITDIPAGEIEEILVEFELEGKVRIHRETVPRGVSLLTWTQQCQQKAATT